jgi:hypothetical protein
MRTNPVGVRFDPEKLEFIKIREKLKTNQQVVDLLINKYWWENKVAVPTHKEAPPLRLREDPVFGMQIKEMPVKKPKTLEDYVLEKSEITDADSYQDWLRELENDPNLTDSEKKQAKNSRI